MSAENPPCVLLADRHHGLVDGIRGLLGTAFEAVVMVADEKSLMESAVRLHPTVAVVDLSLAQGTNLRWLHSLRAQLPDLKIIVLSVHHEPNIERACREAGADKVVLKQALATDLLPAIEAALGRRVGTVCVAPQAPPCHTAAGGNP